MATATLPAASISRQGLRQYYRLRAVGSLANQLLQFAVPVLVYSATNSVVWSGVALFVEWAPRLISLPIAGPLVDRFQVRRVYLVSDGARCVAAACAALSIAVFPATAKVALVALALVAGACYEQTFIAGEKAVRVLAPLSQMHRAQSVLGSIDQSALMAGPALGGALLLLGNTATVLAVTVLFATSAAMTWRLRHLDGDANRSPEATHRPGRTSLRNLTGGVLDGARLVLGDPILRTVITITVVVNLLVGIVLAGAPALLREQFAISGAALGVVYTAAGLASLAFLALTATLIRTFGLYRVGAASALGTCMAYGLLGAAPGFVAFTVLVTAMLAAESVFTVFIRVLRAHVIPPERFASAVGVIVLLNFTSLPIAGLLVASSAWLVPLPRLVELTGVASLVACVALLRRLGRLMPKPGAGCSPNSRPPEPHQLKEQR